MIIWSGFGFLAAVIPILTCLVTVKLVQASLGVDYALAHAWPAAIGTMIGGALVWLAADLLKHQGRKLLDPATGKTVVVRKRNTIFFVPMEYAGIAIAVIGLAMFFLRSGSPR